LLASRLQSWLKAREQARSYRDEVRLWLLILHMRIFIISIAFLCGLHTDSHDLSRTQ